MRPATAAIACTIPVILSATTLTSSSAQTPAGSTRSASTGPKTTWTAARTPWGDPDVNGVYSNDDETGVPFERPPQFEGRRLEDVTPEELTSLNKQRNEQFNAGVAGTEFAGGLRPPTHLIFDSFDRKNSRAWLIVDPPDGKLPPLTDEARQRARQPQGGLGRGVSSNINP